jgi:hypothetical protein
MPCQTTRSLSGFNPESHSLLIKLGTPVAEVTRRLAYRVRPPASCFSLKEGHGTQYQYSRGTGNTHGDGAGSLMTFNRVAMWDAAVKTVFGGATGALI